MGQHSNNQGNLRRFKRSAFISLAFSLLGLYVVIHFTGGYDSWKDITRLEPAILAAAGGLMVLTWLLDCLRMVFLSSSLGADLTILQGMRIAVMGAFASNITPFDSGGEPVQAYMLTEIGLTAGQSTAVIATKTLCNGLARFTLGLVAFLWLLFFADHWRMTKILYGMLSLGVLLYFAVFALSFYLIFHPEKVKVVLVPIIRNRLTLRFFQPATLDMILNRIDGEIQEFRSALEEFVENWRPTLGLAMALSYVYWIVMTLIPYLVIWGLGIRSSLLQVMAITLLFYLISVYIPTPGSSGAAELGFGLMFTSLVPQGLVGIFTLVWRGFTYYLSLTAGAVLMAFDFVKRRKPAFAKFRLFSIFGAGYSAESMNPSARREIRKDFDTRMPNDLQSPSCKG